MVNMGKIALIVIVMAWAFSFLILDPSLSVLPYWLTSNTELYQFTIILWNILFAIFFIRFGLR